MLDREREEYANNLAIHAVNEVAKARASVGSWENAEPAAKYRTANNVSRMKSGFMCIYGQTWSDRSYRSAAPVRLRYLSCGVYCGLVTVP